MDGPPRDAVTALKKEHDMIVGVPKESTAGETRTAMTPAAAAALIKSKLEVVVESGLGLAAGFEDSAYTAKGAKVVSRAEVLKSADILLQVQCTMDTKSPDFEALKPTCLMIGFCDPLGAPRAIGEVATTGVSMISME